MYNIIAKNKNKNSIRVMFFNEKNYVVHVVFIQTDIIKIKIYFRMI